MICVCIDKPVKYIFSNPQNILILINIAAKFNLLVQLGQDQL